MSLNTEPLSRSCLRASISRLFHHLHTHAFQKVIRGDELNYLHSLISLAQQLSFSFHSAHSLCNQLSLSQVIKEQKLPNCGLKANPHIESRLKTLKKQTLAIYDMLSNSSGFSWNHEEKMVVCEKQVFDDWVKVHKDAKGLRMKPFIHYDSLIEAFGRDRANGLGAEGPAEADEDLNNENNYADIEENGLDEMAVPSSVTRNSANPPSARTRKRARDAYSQCLGDMASTLRSFVDVTKAHLETMQGVLMNEHVTSERRGKLVEELMKIEGINDYDVIEAAAAIIGDDSKIDLLFSLPDNLKSQWIHKLLGH